MLAIEKAIALLVVRHHSIAHGYRNRGFKLDLSGLQTQDMYFSIDIIRDLCSIKVAAMQTTTASYAPDSFAEN